MTNHDPALAEAADRLVAAFAAHDRSGYFAAFAEDATFFFHNVDSLLADRAAYESLWAEWENRDGFRVLSCQSTERHLRSIGDTGILTHRVATKARFGSETVDSRERETIVFQKRDGHWLAVHEHLSLEA